VEVKVEVAREAEAKDYIHMELEGKAYVVEALLELLKTAGYVIY